MNKLKRAVYMERVKRNHPSFPTTYPIYFRGMEKDSELTEQNAPRTQETAEEIARVIIEDPNSDYSVALCYEMRPIFRVGVKK